MGTIEKRRRVGKPCFNDKNITVSNSDTKPPRGPRLTAREQTLPELLQEYDAGIADLAMHIAKLRKERDTSPVSSWGEINRRIGTLTDMQSDMESARNLLKTYVK